MLILQVLIAGIKFKQIQTSLFVVRKISRKSRKPHGISREKRRFKPKPSWRSARSVEKILVGSPWSPAIGREGKRLPSLAGQPRDFLVWLLPVGACRITVCLLVRPSASPVLPSIALQVFAVVACFGCSCFHLLFVFEWRQMARSTATG